jgi:glycine oxidase
MSSALVIGGGAIGLAGAWRAARAGVDVTVIDPHPGSGASGVAAGMLAPVTEAHYGEERLLRLNLVSGERFPTWVSELEEDTELDVGYRRSGTLLVARDGDDNAALDDVFTFQQELGLPVRRLRARESRRVEPGLAPGVRGGILVEGDHQIDPAALVGALIHACEKAGVGFVGERCVAVLHENGRLQGVRLAGGSTLEARRAVIAAGAWSGSIEGLPPGSVPVRPVKGQLLQLQAFTEPVPVEHNIRGLEVYIVPRPDGRAVIGATVEERGFDVTITAGAVHELLRRAYELVPGIIEMELVGTHAGLRPGTPDNAPLIGPLEIDGLFAATGHYRNGILLTPVTSDAIASWLTTGAISSGLEPFTPQRFAGREVVAL